MDDQIEQSGKLPPMDLAPGEETEIDIPIKPVGKPRRRAEYWLRISLRTRREKSLFPRGHEIAWEQFPVAVTTPPARVISSDELPSVHVVEQSDNVRIDGRTFSATFSRDDATLTALRYDGRDIIASDTGQPGGPALQAYRAPTDNDKAFGRWLKRAWHAAGLDQMRRVVDSFNVSQPAENLVCVKTAVRNFAAAGSILHRATWTVRGDGSIDLDSQFEPAGSLPALPRVGIVLRVAANLQTFWWLGHGPHENYSDRLQSTPVGLWSSTVRDQYVPYPRPQETGNKEGVRWLALTDELGRGLLVVAEDRPISASALAFAAADLAKAQHAYQLQPRSEVVLSLDARHGGLGNSSCGPGVLEHYSVPVENYRLRVSLRPISADSVSAAAEAARMRYE